MRAVRYGRSGAAVRTGGGMTHAGPQARQRVSCTAGSTGKRGGGARLGGGVAAAGAEAKATTQVVCYASPRPAVRARRVVAAAGPAGGVPQQPGEGDPEKLRKLQELMSMAMDDDQFDDDDDAFADDTYDEDDEEDEEEDDDDLSDPPIMSASAGAPLVGEEDDEEFEVWNDGDTEEDFLENTPAASYTEELLDNEMDFSFNLAELVAGAGMQEQVRMVGPGAMDTFFVSGIADDSRKVQDGDLFVCMKGAKHDGHKYAMEAFATGCAVVVVGEEALAADPPAVDVDALVRGGACVLAVPDTNLALVHLARTFYADPSREMTVVGITGTNGKTTTSWLVRSMLEGMDHRVGLIGTIEYAANDKKLTSDGEEWVPDEEDITANESAVGGGNLWPYKGRYSVANTTPNGLQLQQLYAGMLARECTAVSMEVSSHALAQHRTDGTDFDVAVFTNLSRDHLDYHGTWEEYRAAKLRLFQGLHDPDRQRAVINLDDPEAHLFIQAASRVPIITFSMENPEAAVHATSIKLGLFETGMSMATPDGEVKVLSALIGRPNVYNMLAAAAVGVALGATPMQIASGLETCEGVPGRYEMIDEGQPYGVIVDYAHTPDALERLLRSIRETAPLRIILVFGCGGERDRGKRPIMGRIANDLADVVIVTADNPRGEDVQQICADITAGYPLELHNSNDHHDRYFNHMQDMWHSRHTREWNEMVKVMKDQNYIRRYVLEERFYAIRVAIAMADQFDCVVIAGKGHEDYVEWHVHNSTETKFWFDDRQECRDCLSRIEEMQKAGVDTRNLPWDEMAQKS